MKRVILLATLLFVVGTLAAAQDFPRVETSLGYSFVRVATSGDTVKDFNANGGYGDLQYNLKKSIAIVGKFYGTTNGELPVVGSALPVDQTQFFYLFGPRVPIRVSKRVTPFFEYLIGGVHNSRSFSLANSSVPAGFTPPRGITVEPGAAGYTKFRSTQNAFAMEAGAGLDIAVTKTIAIRPVEIGYLPTHFSPFNFGTNETFLAPLNVNSTRWQQNWTYSAGVTFRLGSKSM
jgi:opacity protein-like surface antigen